MSKLVIIEPDRVTELPAEPSELVVGEWYWYVHTPAAGDGDDEDEPEPGEREFVCLTALGSNYAEVTNRHKKRWRVHFDNIGEHLHREREPVPVIRGIIGEAKSAVMQALREIHEHTAALGIRIDPTQMLAGESDTQALVLASEGRSLAEYKDELRAGKEALPELFQRFKHANESLTEAMLLESLPLRASIVEQSTIVKAVDARIFNIELYAGLTEEAVQVRGGMPAPRDTKLAVRQRMLFMDEECIARYTAGGMRMRHIELFDEWLAEHVDAFLPEPRCVVAFRVRRHPVERDGMSSFLELMYEDRENRRTFLYVRNGEQIWRIETALDFGERLFPDFARSLLDEPLMAVGGYTREREPTPVREWEAMVAEKREKLLADRERYRGYGDEGAGRWWQADRTDEDIEAEVERWKSRWFPVDSRSVWYDDVMAEVKAQVDHYNRVALILQGLFDRSTILHPHEPVKTWDAAGFDAAIQLVYDFDNAIAPPDRPDWKAYQAECNATLRAGSLTVGQRTAWEKRRPSYSLHREWTAKERNDQGPGVAVQVAKVTRKGTVVYRYERETDTYDRRLGGYKRVGTTFECSINEVLNVDAYQLGDFKRFFADPRTRAEYMQWAPCLLAAEDAKAGKVEREPEVCEDADGPDEDTDE